MDPLSSAYKLAQGLFTLHIVIHGRLILKQIRLYLFHKIKNPDETFAGVGQWCILLVCNPECDNFAPVSLSPPGSNKEAAASGIATEHK